jgi:hypothetical protein
MAPCDDGVMPGGCLAALGNCGAMMQTELSWTM